MITCGIDAGSRAIKVVVLDAHRITVLGAAVADQGVEQQTLALRLYEGLLADRQLARGDVDRIVATGYGRNLIAFADTTITEITCHAVGVHHHRPDARTVVDIGGQDSKVIRLDGQGAVEDFAMNDRCAAGTGRFLEVVAQRLNVELTDLGERARHSRRPAAISSMCVVFAETEITGLLAAGSAIEDIVAGVQNSIASRVAAMAGRRAAAPVLFTGGVARIPGMDAALAASLQQPVEICEQPQMTGALGAAILAARQLNNGR